MRDDTTSVLEPILGDGRPLLLPVAASLVFSGGFALFLAATGELPSLYTWLTIFPLEQGQPWAWWVWLVSSAVGFASFLTYLGYGYLDSWHGVGTLLLLPVLVVGMVRARRLLTGTLDRHRLWRPAGQLRARSRQTWGRALLLLGAAATAVVGVTIMWVGVGDTFVPEDLEFIGLSAQLRDINPRLVPLLAHDRAGFGGTVVTMGLTTFLCLWVRRRRATCIKRSLSPEAPPSEPPSAYMEPWVTRTSGTSCRR